MRDISADGSPLRHPKKIKQVPRASVRPPLPPPPAPSPEAALPPPPAAAVANWPLYPVPMVPPPRPATTHSAPEPPLLPRGRRRRPPSRQPACPASPELPGTSARRRLRTWSPPTLLVGKKRLALPIGPALILNGPMGTAVSGRHRDRCCSEREGLEKVWREGEGVCGLGRGRRPGKEVPGDSPELALKSGAACAWPLCQRHL